MSHLPPRKHGTNSLLVEFPCSGPETASRIGDGQAMRKEKAAELRKTLGPLPAEELDEEAID